MSPVIGLARLPGQILSSVHMGNFSPVDRDEIQETQTKMVEHKLVLFVTVIALWTPVKAYSDTPTVEIHTRQKLCYFVRGVAKAELPKKSFVQVTQVGLFIWENFYPVHRDLVNRASPASHMNTSKF